MAEKFETSFIPKKASTTPAKRRKRAMGGLMFLGLVVFLIAVAMAVGAFLYKALVERNIEVKKQRLAEEREELEPSSIELLARLDSRIDIANMLLNEHVAPSPIFELLEEITLETVRFESFSLSFLETGEGVELSMSGNATGFTAVALQSDEFAENEYLSEPIFSGLAVTETGRVTFSATAIVDPELMRYVSSGTSLDTQPLPPENDDVSTTSPPVDPDNGVGTSTAP